MKNNTILKLMSLFLAAIIFSCSNEDTVEPTEEVEGRYLVMSATHFITGDAYLSLYDSIPSGDIENTQTNTTQVSSYGRFNVINNKWAFKKSKFTGETGLVRYSLASDGSLVTDGFISTSASPNYYIVDETTGFYIDADRGTLTVQTFNPKTMARTGDIDVSGIFTEQELLNFDIQVGSKTVVASGGKLFVNAEYTIPDDSTVDGLSEPHYTMAVIDIATSTAEKLIVHQGEVYDQGHGNNTEYPALLVTDDGTIYMSTHALFATDDNGNRPDACVFRINGGETDFDQDWLLNGDDILGDGQLIWSMSYQNNKLFVDCSNDPIATDFSNLLSNMYNVYAINPETKTSTKITGAPEAMFGHTDGNLFEVKDDLYYQVKNLGEGTGSYYKINAETNTASLVFNVTDTYPRALGYLELQE